VVKNNTEYREGVDMEKKMMNDGSGTGTGLVSTLFDRPTAPFVRLRSRLRRRTVSEIGSGMGDCIRGRRTGGGGMGAGGGSGQGKGQNRKR
jgi:hypothetical protein